MLMIIACISMLIDHIGIAFFPDMDCFRIIGRLAMPIYSYFIVQGLEHTSDIKKYFKRLANCCVISQIPFAILMQKPFELNVCFTWLLSLAIIYSIKIQNRIATAATILFAIVISIFLSYDYRFLGVYVTLVFYFQSLHKGLIYDLIATLGVGIIYLCWQDPLQYFAIIAMPIIFFAERHNKVRTSSHFIKNMYRFFYPLHITIIDIIKSVLTMRTLF